MTDEEKSKLFMELMGKKQKAFCWHLELKKRETDILPKAQRKLNVYLSYKHNGGYTYKQLKERVLMNFKSCLIRNEVSKYLCSYGSEGTWKHKEKEGKKVGRK
ncbi:hypothetical protein Tco_1229397 [Tanacetum coccineum]